MVLHNEFVPNLARCTAVFSLLLAVFGGGKLRPSNRCAPDWPSIRITAGRTPLRGAPGAKSSPRAENGGRSGSRRPSGGAGCAACALENRAPTSFYAVTLAPGRPRHERSIEGAATGEDDRSAAACASADPLFNAPAEPGFEAPPLT